MNMMYVVELNTEMDENTEELYVTSETMIHKRKLEEHIHLFHITVNHITFSRSILSIQCYFIGLHSWTIHIAHSLA